MLFRSKADYQALQYTAPYVPRTTSARDLVKKDQIVPGVPPPALEAIRYAVSLPHEPIPDRLWKTLYYNSILSSAIKEVKRLHLPKTLDASTYGRFFKVLIWAEEFRSE